MTSPFRISILSTGAIAPTTASPPRPKVLNRYTITSAENPPVFIGRPSKWQNPFPISEELPRGQALKVFREWVLTQPQLIEDAKRELKGRNLLCTCSPYACHGDFWLNLANGPAPDPRPFEEYHMGEEIKTCGFYIHPDGGEFKLDCLSDAPLRYSDRKEWIPPWIGEEEVYQIEFVLKNPMVLLQQHQSFETISKSRWKKYREERDAVIYVPALTAVSECKRQAVLLKPKEQITSIRRI